MERHAGQLAYQSKLYDHQRVKLLELDAPHFRTHFVEKSCLG